MSAEQSGKHAAAGTPEAIESDIERQREQLADTIDALSEKLDVKQHAQDKVADIRDSVTTDSGRPRPEVVVAVGSLAAMALVFLLWRRLR